MATTTTPRTARNGAAFLLEDITAEEVFTREDLSEEHIAIGRMVEEFWANEVEPNLPAIRQKKPGVALEVSEKVRQAGTARHLRPGKIRRHGDGPAFRDGGGRSDGPRRIVCRLALRAYRNRVAADFVLRHRAAKTKVSSQTRAAASCWLRMRSPSRSPALTRWLLAPALISAPTASTTS